MYIDTSKTTINGKTYHRYLFRESYREDGKVKNRTLGKISKCSAAEIAAIKLALKYKDNLSALLHVEDVELHEGLRVGVVYAVKTLAERLGISKALGSSRQGKLALWQIMARLIGQGSRLGAVRMAASYGACAARNYCCMMLLHHILKGWKMFLPPLVTTGMVKRERSRSSLA